MTNKKARANSPTLVLELPGRRQASGVELRQIVESTKISLRFLEAIEFERFHELPGGIFNTSYIRQYAAAIGMDPAPLLQLYRQKMGLETVPAQNLEPAGKPERTPPLGFSPLL
jgi:cytoskeleton protein RodZ